ncbi:MAG: hypothetical protein Ct9H300mP13_7950 [Gammaproteobacteria bacterium]|nr:MAG: hypothetical protein Ct9H300mP13_7950 [Gammaproteobacteria bacterium]
MHRFKLWDGVNDLHSSPKGNRLLTPHTPTPQARAHGKLFHLEMHMRGCYIARRGFMSLSLPLTRADHDAFANAFESVAIEYGEVLGQQ